MFTTDSLMIPNPEFADGPSPKCALISIYTPKEANSTVEELDEFYLSLDEQVSSFLSNGLSPIIVGDFNLRLGQDSDPSPVTGPNVLGITASRNCSYLFSFCRNYTTTSNLRCSTRELSKDILRTPLNDDKTFIRDLKRKDLKSLISFPGVTKNLFLQISPKSSQPAGNSMPQSCVRLS